MQNKKNALLDINNEIAYRQKIVNDKKASKADVARAKKRIEEMKKLKKQIEGK